MIITLIGLDIVVTGIPFEVSYEEMSNVTYEDYDDGRLLNTKYSTPTGMVSKVIGRIDDEENIIFLNKEEVINALDLGERVSDTVKSIFKKHGFFEMYDKYANQWVNEKLGQKEVTEEIEAIFQKEIIGQILQPNMISFIKMITEQEIEKLV